MRVGGLQAIFLEQRAVLHRLLVARLGSAAEADDVLQDMWLRIDSLADRPIDQPAAFLFRIATNLATDRRIAAQRRHARDGAWHDVQPIAAELPDTERTLIARDRLARVEAAMDDMPERMRTALRMFRFDEQPQRTIATTLGISVSGVEKLLRRAYRRIVDAAGDDGADVAERRRHSDEGKSDSDD